jgi:hypothetical protein
MVQVCKQDGRCVANASQGNRSLLHPILGPGLRRSTAAFFGNDAMNPAASTGAAPDLDFLKLAGEFERHLRLVIVG